MTFTQRLRAAADAMLGRIPQQKGYPTPYFWGMFLQNQGMPQSKPEMNYQKLRQLSETPVPRRAIRFIKSQVSRLECSVEPKAGVKLTAREKRLIESLNNVFNSPNGSDSWSDLVEKIVEDMLVMGWSTNVIKDWSDEHPEHPFLIFPSDAASFQIYLDWNGSPKHRKYAQFSMHGDWVDFLPDELFVIKYDSRANDPFGLSPMAVCAQETEYLLQAMAYSGSVASQAHPKKLLHLGEDADNEFVKEVRLYWRDEVEGRGTLPILGGTKAPTSIELGADSDESLFLKWQSHLIIIVANAFGIDPQKMGVIAGVNRSTGDSMDSVTDDGAIRPVAHTIEGAINNFFLRRLGIYDVAEFKFRFTTSQQDVKALAVLHQIRLQDDSMTINESRIQMGDPSLPVDKDLGKSPGDMTLTEYRAWVQAKYGAIAAASKKVEEANVTAVLGEDQMTDEQKGANGVNGASGPGKENIHKGADKVTDIPK